MVDISVCVKFSKTSVVAFASYSKIGSPNLEFNPCPAE